MSVRTFDIYSPIWAKKNLRAVLLIFGRCCGKRKKGKPQAYFSYERKSSNIDTCTVHLYATAAVKNALLKSV